MTTALQTLAQVGLSLVALSFICTGCGDGTQTLVHENEAPLCIHSEGGALVVHVKVPGCLSSSCDDVMENRCSVAVEGTQIVVKSRSVVESRGGTCTDDCGAHWAECRASAAASGAHTVTYGDKSTTVVLPADLVQVFADTTPDQMEAACGFDVD